MAYNKDFPADDSYLADFPANEREQIRAIVEDKIVNAGKVNGLTTSNGSGQVPVSNGTVNTNLNADLLDGHHAEYFSPSGHRHNNASTSSDGFMSSADKVKLDGVATGAEVNQNAFGNVAVGSTTLQADNKQDTLYINAGSNISIAADAANDKLTIALSGIVPVAKGGTGQSNLGNVTVGGATALASQGNKTAIKDGTAEPSGLQLYKVYNNGYPANYGNLISIGGTGGGELLAGWSGTDHGVEHLYYRNRRNNGALWSAWNTIAFITDINNYAPTKTGAGATGTWPVSVSGNAGTATKLVTQRTISVSGTGLTAAGQAFDGTRNITIPITLANALLALAGVTPSAGKIPVFTGANTASLASITDFMKTLLGKASAGDVRSAIGAVDASGAGVVAGNVSNANAWWVKLGGTVPLIIQGGYQTGKSGSWAIAFPHALLGISGDYSGTSGKMDWGPSISGDTTGWAANSSGSNVRVIAIGY